MIGKLTTGRPAVKQFLYQIGHIERLPFRNVVPGRRFKQIGSCIDKETKRGLFLKSCDSDILALHDSKGNLHVVFANSYSEHRPLLPVVRQHFLKGKPGKNVAVDHQKRSIRPFHLPQSARRAHGVSFLQIIQSDPEAFAIPKMLHYGFRKIVRGQVYIADTAAAQLLNG